MSLDAHERPPESLRLLFKKLQKSSVDDIDASSDILDFAKTSTCSSSCVVGTTTRPKVFLEDAYSRFLNIRDYRSSCSESVSLFRYEIRALPGLFVYPALLPVEVQEELLNRLLHRDLSVEKHKTNLHLHYHIQYPAPTHTSMPDAESGSFFGSDTDVMLGPRDPAVHKPMTIRQMLERKLRWMTLGGQYDWTAKVYPSEEPPEFPQDVSRLLRSIWPDVDAQAAIVNFYTPGDTLSVHRDVSEECDRGLVSISIGCDGLFIIGNEDGTSHATLRLRSGDAVLMSGKSRFAWHAVPKILPNTCPAELQAWPACSTDSEYESWRGWLTRKRINLNVRQMRLI